MGLRRYLAAGGVLAAGCAAAIPFYQPALENDPVAARSTESPLLAVTDPGGRAGEGEQPSLASSNRRSDSGKTGVSLGRPQTPAVATGPSQPPRMAASFSAAIGSGQRWAGQPAKMSPPVAGQVGQAASSAKALRSKITPQPGAPAIRTSRERSHSIRDGDTLASISRQYYGSINFAGFLYAENRDALSSPDLLPIGRVLRIPATPREIPLPAIAQPAATQPAATSSDSIDPRRLVPVRWN